MVLRRLRYIAFSPLLNGLRLPRLSLYGNAVAPFAERRTNMECKFDATWAGAVRAPVASIGGAGTFDGIFIPGMLAILLA